MFRKIIEYIGIGKTGWIELIIALYPILAGYGYGSFRLSFGVLLILDILILFQGKRRRLKSLPLMLFFAFTILHDLFFLFVIPEVTSSYINSLIALIIFIFSVYIIAPQLDFNKLKSAVNIVALVCMGGMLYHVVLLSSGQEISPIKFPLLPEMAKGARLYMKFERPTSFFWEPQSYVSFMLVPLYFALRDRKMIFAMAIAVTMLMSTSTTGLILSLLMFVLTLGNGKWYTKILGIFVVVFLIYFLISSQYTAASLDKLQQTDLEESNRVMNGFLIANSLSISDLLLGIPFPNEQYAYDVGYFHAPLIVMNDGVLFISAIWISLIRYGVLGFLLFLNIYYWIYRQNKALLPYLACIVVALFSNPDYIGASFDFQLLIMLTVIFYDKRRKVRGRNILAIIK